MVSLIKPMGVVAMVSALGVLLGASSVSTTARAKERCRRVHGTSNTLFTSENCTSPVGLCTSGTVTGGGPLDGAFMFMAFDAAPSAGMPSIEPAANISFSGQVTFNGRRGTLVTHDLGVLDAANGFFTEVERPATGTGSFANPSHDFFINGIVNSTGNGFIGEISGTLCSDRSADDSDDD